MKAFKKWNLQRDSGTFTHQRFCLRNIYIIFTLFIIIVIFASCKQASLQMVELEKGNLLLLENVSMLNEELALDEIISYYDLDSLSFGSYNESMASLNSIPEFKKYPKSLQCKQAIKEVKKRRCAKSTKYVKEIVRKYNLGKFSIEKEGTLGLNLPSSAVFRSEINKLNAIIIAINEVRFTYCKLTSYCNPSFIEHYCTVPTPEESSTYKECQDLILNSRFKYLDKSLTIINEALKDFEERRITEADVKAVMATEIDTIEKETTKATEETEQDEQNVDQTDSTGIDG